MLTLRLTALLKLHLTENPNVAEAYYFLFSAITTSFFVCVFLSKVTSNLPA